MCSIYCRRKAAPYEVRLRHRGTNMRAKSQIEAKFIRRSYVERSPCQMQFKQYR